MLKLGGTRKNKNAHSTHHPEETLLLLEGPDTANDTKEDEEDSDSEEDGNRGNDVVGARDHWIVVELSVHAHPNHDQHRCTHL